MNKTSQTTQRAIAFGLAAVMSLAMLAGVDGLAQQQHGGADLAQGQQVQRVVVVSTPLPGRRSLGGLPRPLAGRHKHKAPLRRGFVLVQRRGSGALEARSAGPCRPSSAPRRPCG